MMEYYEALKHNRQCMFFSEIVMSYKNMPCQMTNNGCFMEYFAKKLKSK